MARRKRRKGGGILRSAFIALALCVLFALGAVAGMVASYARDLPDIGRMADYQPASSTRIFSRDGTLLASGSTDGTVRLWDVATQKELAVLSHGTNAYGMSFTPDGTRLAVGCADNTIRLWDVATRQEVAELRGHTEYIHGLAFDADGSRLVSASGDGTLRVWDSVPRSGPR